MAGILLLLLLYLPIVARGLFLSTRAPDSFGRLFGGMLAMTLALLPPAASAEHYHKRPEVQSLIAEMVDKHDFDAATLNDLFSQIKVQKFSLETTTNPPERIWTWRRYHELLVSKDRMRGGVKFWNAHRETLRRAETQYGVPAAVITAIIGVETRYGTVMGKHRVMDALTTLAFDGLERRREFFGKELREYLLLAREQGFAPREVRGSYAGAMGYGQFIPSSYRNFAVDFDADEKIDLLGNPTDAIGSIANYLMRNGWRRAQPVATRVDVAADSDDPEVNKGRRPKRSVDYWGQRGYESRRPLPDATKALLLAFGEAPAREYWFALHNFDVVMSYNPRYYYAMAVYQLARAICARVGCNLDFAASAPKSGGAPL